MHIWPSILALAFAFQEPQSNTTIKNLSVAKCDIEELLMPLNADKWTCDKPIYQTKVKKNTRCTIACLYGHDVRKGNLQKIPKIVNQ